ncbi:hypothetical protein Tco_0206217 [Tanacetum coccineum]
MIGCLPSNFPCTYLGLSIGGNMSRCANWGILVDKFNKRLSNWKSMSLSFGGRFTLIKFVLGSFGGETTDENKIAWDKATSSISNGGLGIGTVKSSNHAMLSKWWWRFHTENHAFWCKIIRSIHGVDGGLNDTSLIKSKSGPWYRIAKLKDDLSKIGIDLPSIFKKKIGDSCSTRFWLDTWIRGSPLKDTFPRLFWLDSNPACLVCNRCPTFQPLTHVSSAATSYSAPTFTPPIGLIFNWAWSRPIRSSLELCELSEFSLVAHLWSIDNSDCGNLENIKNAPVGNRGNWSGGNWDWIRSPRGRVVGELKDMEEIITVKSLSEWIERRHVRREAGITKIEWNTLVPRKENVFIWRALKESVDHCLVTCEKALYIWESIFAWWGIALVDVFTIKDILQHLGGRSLGKEAKALWHAVVLVAVYYIWKSRNMKVKELATALTITMIVFMAFTSSETMAQEFAASPAPSPLMESAGMALQVPATLAGIVSLVAYLF